LARAIDKDTATNADAARWSRGVVVASSSHARRTRRALARSLVDRDETTFKSFHTMRSWHLNAFVCGALKPI